MKFLLILCCAPMFAQNIQSLSAQIQRTPSAALYVERGTAYLEAGDAKQAVADFDRALERNSMLVPALTLRAQAYTKLGRYDNAVTDLSGAIALAPGDATLFLARSEAYAAAGDARRALTDREEALRLDPNVVESANAAKAARALEASAPPPVETPAPQTAAPKTSAAPVQPAKPAPAVPGAKEDAAVLYQRGRDFFDKGKYADGIAQVSEAIRLQPRNAVYYNTRGFGHYLNKDFNRAIDDFNQALKIDPNYLNAVHNRALAKRAAGDMAGYNADRELELKLSPARKGR